MAACLALLAASCTGGSPLAPDLPLLAGAHILRATLQGNCPDPPPTDASSLGTVVHTRVDVRADGLDWVATASGAAGDVLLRIRSGGITEHNRTLVIGTIGGTARHMPELVPGAPPWEAFMNFGPGDARVEGVSQFILDISSNTAIDGTGTGVIRVSNSTGASCSGAAFTWSLSPG
jgi:hypothetical protein